MLLALEFKPLRTTHKAPSYIILALPSCHCLFPTNSSSYSNTQAAQSACCTNELKIGSVYWLLGCLHLHRRLRFVSSEADWCQTPIFIHLFILKTAQISMFLAI